ncbi:MAG: hypothetical protein ACYSSO_11300 [Planctomycetota bacterium]|jgi:hypothetical protein
MVAYRHNQLCKEAKLHYYDFLFSEGRGDIPESTIEHLEQCKYCKEQISKLKEMLLQTDSLKSEQEQVSSTVAAMLKLHFAYTGKPVTCDIVKPFLPGLLDSTLGMSIPSPIVTHIFNCKECSEDLDVIRSLSLGRKQLCRLSQLFADKSTTGDDTTCSKAENAIASIASMAFSETDSEVLKHVCKCYACRELVYKERQKICDSLLKEPPPLESSCDQVSSNDIFDCTVPYGIEPGRHAKLGKSFTRHAVSCPNCLTKMQELHKTVSYIAERAESEVVTIYTIGESAKAQAVDESEQIYSGLPINVEVIKREDKAKTEQPAATVNFAAALKQKISATQLKPFIKTVGAAAAVILITATLLFHTSTAKAVTLEKIYQAIQRLKNVHISTFDPVESEPGQQAWISRPLNIYMTKTEKQLVLWDITNGVRKSKSPDGAVMETAPLSGDNLVDVGKKMSGSLGLMPFYSMSEVPANAKWSPVDTKSLEVADGTEVYDLIWAEKAHDGSFVPNKWRFFVDTKTNLPQRGEFYRKETPEGAYTLELSIVVEYLDNSKMESVIKEHSF